MDNMNIDKKNTRVDMSLEDYEKLKNDLKWYKEKFEKLTDNIYTKYEIKKDNLGENTINNFEFEENNVVEYVEFKFDVMNWLKDNYVYFSKNDDELDYFDVCQIKFEIKE